MTSENKSMVSSITLTCPICGAEHVMGNRPINLTCPRCGSKFRWRSESWQECFSGILHYLSNADADAFRDWVAAVRADGVPKFPKSAVKITGRPITVYECLSLIVDIAIDRGDVRNIESLKDSLDRIMSIARYARDLDEEHARADAIQRARIHGGKAE